MTDTPQFTVPEHQHRYLDPQQTQVQYLAWLLSEYDQGRDHRPEIRERLNAIRLQIRTGL